ncbi:MAG: elongation factor Ts [Candidatus Phytoplasma sp.]|nr:elongation factor Ts [Phytoplasma sp.]
MVVTAKMVKELRDKTGAGMLDCKKALEATNGDIELAIDYLRERGIAQAAKKADRIAAEGLTNYVISGNEAVLYELNSETDFVAKNAQFVELLDTVGQIILNSKATNTEEALELVSNGKTVSLILADATATIGEKITLRRVQRLTKADGQGFGAYKHMGGRISVVTVLNKENDELARDIAMHVAASNPRFLDQTQVDAETLEREKHVLTEQALAEGKPANIVEKMIQGRLNKFLQEICLVDQPFVKDPDLKVSQYLKNNNNEVLNYVRLEVGEGIEKREENFAEEVAAQLKK